jgi:hypothetical protein
MPWNDIVPAVPGQVIAAAYFNEQGPEQISGIKTGESALDKVTLAGGATNPAVSGSGEAVMFYNTALGELVSSLNGGAYERLGAKPAYADPMLIGGTAFGFQYSW